MKFAFLIMGEFDMEKDRASIHGGDAGITGVFSTEEACAGGRASVLRRMKEKLKELAGSTARLFSCSRDYSRRYCCDRCCERLDYEIIWF